MNKCLLKSFVIIFILLFPFISLADDRASILFLGLWDRATPFLKKAAQELGISIRILKINKFLSPEDLKKKLEKIKFENYELIYILQINQYEAHILSNLLSKAKKINPALKVIELDYRASHQELIAAGIMEQDSKVKLYWKNFSQENLKRLLLYSKLKFLKEKEGTPLPALEIIQAGFYHPQAKRFFNNWQEYISWYKEAGLYKEGASWVAIILKLDYVIYNNSKTYDALIKELEDNEINVFAIFGDAKGLQRLLLQSKPSLMVLQHHSGPEEIVQGNEKPFLEKLGIPYLYGAGLLGRITIEEWKKDLRSASWANYASLARHEIHGIIEPHIIGAKAVKSQKYLLDEPIEERVKKFVARIKGWINLQRKKNSEKKIAIVYFHKYLSKADIGRPAMEMGRYLDIPKSLFKLIHRLYEEGYKIAPLPRADYEILEWMRKARNIPGWRKEEIRHLVEETAPILIPEEKYQAWFKSKLSPKNQKLVIEKHGPPPGDIMIYQKDDRKYIVLPVIRLGNLILAPQPDIGLLENLRLLNSKLVPPSHNFLAFYFWLQEEFKADAIIHFGAFGKEVFLPGKEVFLSQDCFPDIVIGKIPNIYIWPLENIAIGVIAKRRTYAVLIDHLSPAVVPLKLSTDYTRLENEINQYLLTQLPQLKSEYKKTITELAKQLKLLDKAQIVPTENGLLSDEDIKKLLLFLSYIKAQNYPSGMHVLGSLPSYDKMIKFVLNILANNSNFFQKLKELKVINSLEETKDVERILNFLDMFLRLNLPITEAGERSGIIIEKRKIHYLEKELEFARTIWKKLKLSATLEISNLIRALEGKYIPPGTGGNPLLNPNALPTGRNMYGISIYQIPTPQAWEIAVQLVDKFLQEFYQKNGSYPERIAFPLNGMETFRDMGVMEAEILYLIGVKPVWNQAGLLSGIELIPKEELKRPRIDVLVSLSSIYIKNFPFLIQLIDEAISLAITAEKEDNFLIKTKNEIKDKLLSAGIDESVADKLSRVRIFGPKPGRSGARLIWLLPRSGMWNRRDDIANLWNNIRANFYTKYEWGKENPLLYKAVLKGRQAVITSWGNNLYGPLANHHYPEETGGLVLACELLTAKKPEVIVQDLRNRKRSYLFSLKEAIYAELIATYFNKEWIQSQMEYGYLGATQFMQIADNLFQWEAVNKGLISKDIWEEIINIYYDDKFGINIVDWFMHTNPYAYQEMTATLLEASRKGFWEPSPQELEMLVRAYASFVVRFGYNAGPYSGGNWKFHNYLKAKLKEIKEEKLLASYRKKISSFIKPVEGKKLLEKSNSSPPAKKKISLVSNFNLLILYFFFLFLYGYLKMKGSPK